MAPGGNSMTLSRRAMGARAAPPAEAVASVPQAPAAAPRLPVLVWNWGRRAAGPLLAKRIGQALAEDGRFDVHLSVSRQAEIFPSIAALGLPMHVVDTYTDHFSFLRRSLALGAIRRELMGYLRAAGIGTVLSTMPHLWEYAASRGFRAAGIRRVTMAHDAEMHPGERNLLVQTLMDRTVGSADHVITQSRAVGLRLQDRLQLGATRMTNVPLGVLADQDPGTPLARLHRRPLRLLFFGRILKYKGLDRLVAAVSRLRAAGAEVHLTIAGAGQACDLAPLAGDVELINRWIPEGEIETLFRRADLVVLPYVEASQSGIIPLAYAWGVPVVASPVGGLVEQVHDGETGLIAASHQPEDLAAAISRFITEPGLHERCARGARALVDQALNWRVLAGQLGDVLVDVTAAR